MNGRQLAMVAAVLAAGFFGFDAWRRTATFQDGLYTSRAYGFSMRVPASWVHATPENLATLLGGQTGNLEHLLLVSPGDPRHAMLALSRIPAPENAVDVVPLEVAAQKVEKILRDQKGTNVSRTSEMVSGFSVFRVSGQVGDLRMEMVLFESNRSIFQVLALSREPDGSRFFDEVKKAISSLALDE